MNTISLSCWTFVVLLFWFETDAILDWAKLIRLDKWLDAKAYYETKQRLGISYPDFLASNHTNFLTNLLACPICLGSWVASLIVTAGQQIELWPLVYAISLFMFYAFKRIKV